MASNFYKAGAAAMTSNKDDWETPQSLFDQLDEEFHFILDAASSSQICSQCGRRDGRKPLDIREWECPQCGIRLDRDWNAALNILDAAGLAESLNARGGDVRRRLAQTGRNADAREAGTRRTARLH